jgi:hypothetical protein
MTKHHVLSALEAQARKTALSMIKERARDYAREPEQLDAIYPGLAKCLPSRRIEFLKTIRAPLWRYKGLGGEVQAINLRGAMVYARASRRFAK